MKAHPLQETHPPEALLRKWFCTRAEPLSRAAPRDHAKDSVWLQRVEALGHAGFEQNCTVSSSYFYIIIMSIITVIVCSHDVLIKAGLYHTNGMIGRYIYI